MPAGLGIYWSVSNLFQMVQTIFINKYYAAKDRKKAA
jgi:membrane protein insertase Oxa1/YidC/SpoIIIJ